MLSIDSDCSIRYPVRNSRVMRWASCAPNCPCRYHHSSAAKVRARPLQAMTQDSASRVDTRWALRPPRTNRSSASMATMKAMKAAHIQGSPTLRGDMPFSRSGRCSVHQGLRHPIGPAGSGKIVYFLRTLRVLRGVGQLPGRQGHLVGSGSLMGGCHRWASYR
ncbi:hypothetical protein D3C78_1083970 [compost metagenome]